MLRLWTGPRAVAGALITASLLCPGAAFARAVDGAELADLSLDDLLRVEVLGASRYAQPLTDSPASVTVLDREELSAQSYRNLGEALATVPGVYTTNDRGYTYLGVRGFNRPGDYNSRILLLTDGARRNDALYDQAQLGHESPIEIDWIKRLEFVSGPVSAVYGGNALSGIVNAVMLDGADIDGTRVTVDGGSGHSRRLGIVGGRALDDGDLFVAFAAYDARGDNHYYPEFDDGTRDGWARGEDGEHYHKAYAKLRLGNWRLSGNFSTRAKDLPNAPYETAFGAGGTRTKDSSSLVELAHDSVVGGDLEQHVRLFSGHYRYDGYYRYDDPIDNRDEAVASWSGIDYRLAGTAGETHRWMVGAEAQWNWRLEQRNYYVAPYREMLRTDDPSTTRGVFIQDQWRLHPEWLLNLGLRYDWHSDYDGIASPRVALIYQPDDSVSFKAMVNHAYRPPNAYERFYHDGDELQKANPELDPERIRSVQLSADFRLGAQGRAGIALYRNDMRDMIDQVTDPDDGLEQFVNRSRVEARGVELDAEHRWTGGYRLRGSVAWQQSRTDGGETLVNSPRLIGKLIFAVPLGQGWSVAGQWQAMTERKSLKGRVAGHGSVNLVLSSPESPTWGRLRLGIYNVGDRDYADPVSSAFVNDAMPQDGRQFRLSWTVAL